MAVKMTGNNEVLVSMDRVAAKILFIRGQKVMLDSDLAELYEVEAKVLNQTVKRNIERFPADFMFQLTAEEVAQSRSQFVTLKTGRGQHRKYQPYAFTEQGVAMLSSVLRSERAIHVNIEIMRAFVRLRHDCMDAGGRATQEQLPRCSPPTRSWPENSPRWNRNTTPNSRWCSMRSGS
jgi:phage regulator Rha-like protein